MTRRTLIITVLVVLPLAALCFWIAENTYWGETTVPMPPRGEALTNPFYAAQRFAEQLGARTTWDRVLVAPSPDAVIVLSTWQWSLSASRRTQLERWVESGGRLVVDAALSGGLKEFEAWSGIVYDYQDDDDLYESDKLERDGEHCRKFRVEHTETNASATGALTTENLRRSVCRVDIASFLTSHKQPTWSIRDVTGVQAMRVRVGKGSVTVINTTPFRYRGLFDGDHAWLLVAATQLRRGDDVHFLSEDEHPSLVALIWQFGAPVVALSLAVVALMLWRGGVRFGPLAAPTVPARRSLAEQIRGTGQFVLRHGNGEALHAASVRALDEAAQRREKTYAQRSAKERIAALASLTGMSDKVLGTAIHHPDARRPQELRRTIARLETARRLIVQRQTRSSHGTR